MKKTNYKLSFSTWLILVLISANSFTAFSQTSDHSCGEINVHNTAISNGQVSDIDGNTYKTVVIDDLVWFSENLKVTRFQNGATLQLGQDSLDPVCVHTKTIQVMIVLMGNSIISL
jgi:hypothetical protein